MTFYECFVNLCESIGKKPNTVGKELGIGSSIITQWKNGSIPSTEKILLLANYFDVSTDFLLGRTINKSSHIGNTISGNSDNSINVGTKSAEALSEPTDTMTRKFFDVFVHLDFAQQVNVMKYALEQAEKSA